MQFRSFLVPALLVCVLPLGSSQAATIFGTHGGTPAIGTQAHGAPIQFFGTPAMGNGQAVFSIGQAFLTKPAKSGGNAYAAIIAKHARANGVPVALASAVVQIESKFNPRVTGRAGEIGLMQIKLQSARAMGYSGTRAGLYDPETNIKYGMKYLGTAHKLGGGSTCGTILKYNGGHYAKRMQAGTRKYCGRVQQLMARG
jgi:soluble lytic murein transglycosylase-like protein